MTYHIKFLDRTMKVKFIVVSPFQEYTSIDEIITTLVIFLETISLLEIYIPYSHSSNSLSNIIMSSDITLFTL